MTGAAGPAGPGWPNRLPRVVATDLDGTLLRSDGTISERTRSALVATEEAGTSVLFVTARPPRWVEPLADAVGSHGVVIAGNGAFLVDLARGEVTSSGCFAGADLLSLVADLRAHFPDAGFALERRAGMTVEATFASPHGEDHDAASVVARLADAWAFGDMPNDLPMLQWAGMSFGVEGGHPDVIARTTHTCPANDADGVASVLEHALADGRGAR